ncbi:hypothetical protein [Idiomarina piscisalsi]|uniref:Uncharacterized protein n=1 Tax=Idiomarina piscisalsi TaxID=1096243 RepID=A0A432YPB9_9GAMM|nr:hypothetical protein [Idiomarina piscisalsi]RUO62796.1 hypothetical protein CWI73_10030 [Idiomarina piscisalsi]
MASIYSCNVGGNKFFTLIFRNLTMQRKENRGRKKESFEKWLNRPSDNGNTHKDEIVRAHCIQQLPKSVREAASQLTTPELYKRALHSVPMGEAKFLDELKVKFRHSRPKKQRMFGELVNYIPTQVKIPKSVVKAMDQYISRKENINNRSELFVKAFQNLQKLDKDLKFYYKEWEADVERNFKTRVEKEIDKKERKISKLMDDNESLKSELASHKKVIQRCESLMLVELEGLYSRLDSYEELFDRHSIDYAELRKPGPKLSRRAHAEMKHLKSRIRELRIEGKKAEPEEASSSGLVDRADSSKTRLKPRKSQTIPKDLREAMRDTDKAKPDCNPQAKGEGVMTNSETQGKTDK